MQVEVEFYDENGKEIVFPTWPGDDRGMPPVSKVKANRRVYSHSFLALLGHSLSLSDSIATVKKMLVACTPMLSKGLAVGYYIKELKFSGTVLEDRRSMSDYQIKVNTSMAVFTGNTMESIHAILGVEVNVTMQNSHIVNLPFDHFDSTKVTCHQIMLKLEKASGLPLSSLRLIRRYPCVKPIKFIADEYLMGFKGKFEKGICIIQPHKGPIFPAIIPTPPEMTINVADRDEFDILELEEEWYSRFKSQVMWEGEVEALSGQRDLISIRLDNPRPPVWYYVRAPGATQTVVVHELTKQSIVVKGVGNRDFIVADPDNSPLHGPCVFKKTVPKQEVENGPLYLPSPEMIKQSGITYPKYKVGTSFGKATITFPWKEVTGYYKLEVKAMSTEIMIVGKEERSRISDEEKGRRRQSGDADDNVDVVVGVNNTSTGSNSGGKVQQNDDEIYLVFEGIVAKGISDTYYTRGLYYVKSSTDIIPVSLKRPYCLFKLTPGGTVPEVATSAMGIRYARLKYKSYTMFTESLQIESIGDANEWLPFAKFYALFPKNSPRVCLADILFQNQTNSTLAYQSVCIFWCLTSNAESSFSTFPIIKLSSGRVLIRAGIVSDLRTVLENRGIPIGLGLPSFEMYQLLDENEKEKLPKPVANTSAIQAIREGKGIIHEPHKPSVAIKNTAPPQTRYAQPTKFKAEQSESKPILSQMRMDFLATDTPPDGEVDALDLLNAIYHKQDEPEEEEEAPKHQVASYRPTVAESAPYEDNSRNNYNNDDNDHINDNDESPQQQIPTVIEPQITHENVIRRPKIRVNDDIVAQESPRAQATGNVSQISASTELEDLIRAQVEQVQMADTRISASSFAPVDKETQHKRGSKGDDRGSCSIA